MATKYFVIIDANSYTSNSTYTTPTRSHTTGNAYVSGNSVYGSATTTTTEDKLIIFLNQVRQIPLYASKKNQIQAFLIMQNLYTKISHKNMALSKQQNKTHNKSFHLTFFRSALKCR